MSDITTPYLCLGTFMTQLLRFVDATTTARDRANGKSESHSVRLIYKGLINIYHMHVTYLAEGTLKPYASDVKSCKQSRPEYAEFDKHDIRKDFDADIKKKNSDSLKWMQDFTAEYLSINTDVKEKRLVKIMLKMIAEDLYIEPAQKFYILGNGKSISKSEIPALKELKIEALLLGILHYIISSRSDKNEIGAETYKAMCTDSYNDWLEEYDISHLEKISLLGYSGISEEQEEEQEEPQENDTGAKSENMIPEEDTTEQDSIPDDNETSANENTSDNSSQGFNITPNVTQYIQKQVVNNTKTIVNNAPINHIDTINL